MALIHYSLPNLIGGISQQPLALRFRTQAEAQENAYPSTVDGLIKRHPTKHIARIIDPAPSTAFVHTIDRDAAERYVVTIADSALKVFSLDGTEHDVYGSQAGAAVDFSYLSATSSDHRALTVADFTFILNTAATAAEVPTFPTTPSEDAFIFVRQGAALTDYEVTLTRGGVDTTFTVTTWDGSSTGLDHCEGAWGNDQVTCELNGGTWITNDQLQSLKTDDIADRLRTLLDADPQITATRQGSVIRLVPTSGNEFESIEVSDSLGDTALIKIFKEVPIFADLPLIGLHGYRVKISGEPLEGSSQVDDYYVVFEADGGSGTFGQGRWVETNDGIANTEIDEDTMPHKLVRYQDDGVGTVTGTANEIYFAFEPLTWGERLVGDTLTNPSPSFIGQKIKDLFFFRGRLGFLADQNVIMSEVNQFFNFWRTTVLTLVDSDPIDVASNTTRVSILNHAVPLAERLIVFSDRTQFVLNDRPTLTPATAALRPVLEYENSIITRPASSGVGLFFAMDQGSFSGLREMIAIDDQDLFQADEVTAHVAKYMPGDILEMDSSTLENTLLVRSSGEPNTLFVHNYFWANRQKVQSAWSKFTFDAEVLSASWIRSTVYLVMKRSDGLYLESMEISSGLSDPDSEYVVHLDRRIDSADLPTPVYDASNDYTTFTFPFPVPSNTQAVLQATSSREAGVTVQVDSILSSTLIRLRGDQTSESIWFGIPYTMRYELTPPLLKDNSGQGESAYSNANFLMRTMFVEYDKTGYFRVKYTPDQRPPYEHEFTGQILETNAQFGVVNLREGKWRTFILGLANPRTKIEIINDSPLPCRLLSLEIEGEQDQRSQRI